MMHGKYPRSVYVVLSNPVSGREAEFNYWYNDIHVPDILSLGVFDRVYRYQAMGEAKAQYLAVWESDYSDLNGVMPEIRCAVEGLKAKGRMWPVFEIVWAKPFFAVGPLAPSTGKTVAFATLAQTNCEDPSREDEFNHWYNEMHIPEYLDVGYNHSAYRYQRYDSPPGEDGKFMALYESDRDPAELPQIQNDMAQRHVPVWYEKVGENRLKVRQQEGKSRPRDLVLQTLPPWVSTWRPIFSKGAGHSGDL